MMLLYPVDLPLRLLVLHLAAMTPIMQSSGTMIVQQTPIYGSMVDHRILIKIPVNSSLQKTSSFCLNVSLMQTTDMKVMNICCMVPKVVDRQWSLWTVNKLPHAG